MKRLLCAAAMLLLCGGAASAQNTRPHAGMIRYPDVSATHIVFVYANDLWTVPREGGLASPLASPPGTERYPRFSRDGKLVGFEGNYEGNRDIYVIPVEGGISTRITYHSALDMMCDWTPDGRIIYATNGFAGLGRQQQLFTVSAKGGPSTKLPVPYGTNGTVSSDGRWLAYQPHSTDFATWKRYRGGMASDIWLFDLQEKKSRRMTDWEGTDTLPMWHGSKVYYLSDQGAEHRLNIWVYDTTNGRRQQVTKLSEFDVKFPAIGPGPSGQGEIVFQYGASLQLLDLATGRARAVEVRIPGDRPTLRPRAVDVSRFINGWAISSTGKRAAIEARGDIWTAPAKEGSPRNLTRTSGAAERDPAWSPDGRWIAYLSDATGEYELYLVQSDGRGEPRRLTQDGAVFRYEPQWSPDSKKILFSDKTGALYLVDVAGGAPKLVDTDPWAVRLRPSWSHDSRWLAYSKNADRQRVAAIWIYNVETGEKRQVTRGMFHDTNPVFDRKGEWLYFASTRSFQPTYEDIPAGTTWIYRDTGVILAVPLRNDIAAPFLPKSDEETFKAPAPAATALSDALADVSTPQAQDEVSGTWTGTATGDFLPGGSINFKLVLMLAANGAVSGTMETPLGAGSVTGTYKAATRELSLAIALDGGVTVNLTGVIAGGVLTGTATAQGETARIRAERIGAPPAARPAEQKPGEKPADTDRSPERVRIDFDGFESRAVQLPLRAGRFGQLAVNDRNQLLFARFSTAGAGDPPAIKLFDLKDEKREEKTVAAAATAFDISADGKKILLVRGNAAAIQDASAGAAAENVVTTGMTAMIDPRAEWKQMLTEAWRIERDFFYDPTMHGVDWKKVRDQYEKMLADAVSREDLGFIIGEMIAELNVGHAYYSGGDVGGQPSVPVGLLGADLTLDNGAYRIAQIYRGAPWDTDAVGPLSQPGVKVNQGDYLLAVNGVPLDPALDPYAAFQGMANQTVTLTVSAKPRIDSDARDVVVRLLGSDSGLRYRHWIERNRAYVEQKTNGRVGYIYVPDTGQGGQSDLVRQFVGQRGMDALIIDERWNGGGQIPTRFIELLNRPVTNYWARRDGNDWVWPPDAHFGPKVMLINGLAGSGGDAFPWYFKQAGLGKLIGTRTWGGLVGISGNPSLIDGASVTAPTFAFYRKEGSWAIEGHGVDPDIEVVDDPALMVDGGDPQLDAAIAHILEELKKRPYVAPKRPAYPNRSGFGINDRDR